MLKFIRGKGQQPSTERQKLQKELFAFRRVSRISCFNAASVVHAASRVALH